MVVRQNLVWVRNRRCSFAKKIFVIFVYSLSDLPTLLCTCNEEECGAKKGGGTGKKKTKANEG